jgi:hypothetical protein
MTRKEKKKERESAKRSKILDYLIITIAVHFTAWASIGVYGFYHFRLVTASRPNAVHGFCPSCPRHDPSGKSPWD